MFNVENQQGPAGQLRELCAMSCGSLDGRGVWGRMDTCVSMVECLCCPPKVSQRCKLAMPQNNRKFLKVTSITRTHNKIDSEDGLFKKDLIRNLREEACSPSTSCKRPTQTNFLYVKTCWRPRSPVDRAIPLSSCLAGRGPG